MSSVPASYSELIYADPPWRYDFSKSDSRKIENQYPTMALDEIVAMKPKATLDAILLLWTTAPKLLEGLMVVEGWGFDYRTQLVWDKIHQGMGYWFRGQHEVLLLGVRGSPPLPEVKIPSVFYGKRGGHSRKPAGIKTWISRAWPNLKKVELFSREEGWPGWENATTSPAPLLDPRPARRFDLGGCVLLYGATVRFLATRSSALALSNALRWVAETEPVWEAFRAQERMAIMAQMGGGPGGEA